MSQHFETVRAAVAPYADTAWEAVKNGVGAFDGAIQSLCGVKKGQPEAVERGLYTYDLHRIQECARQHIEQKPQASTSSRKARAGEKALNPAQLEAAKNLCLSGAFNWLEVSEGVPAERAAAQPSADATRNMWLGRGVSNLLASGTAYYVVSNLFYYVPLIGEAIDGPLGLLSAVAIPTIYTLAVRSLNQASADGAAGPDRNRLLTEAQVTQLVEDVERGIGADQRLVLNRDDFEAALHGLEHASAAEHHAHSQRPIQGEAAAAQATPAASSSSPPSVGKDFNVSEVIGRGLEEAKLPLQKTIEEIQGQIATLKGKKEASVRQLSFSDDSTLVIANFDVEIHELECEKQELISKVQRMNGDIEGSFDHLIVSKEALLQKTDAESTIALAEAGNDLGRKLQIAIRTEEDKLRIREEICALHLKKELQNGEDPSKAAIRHKLGLLGVQIAYQQAMLDLGLRYKDRREHPTIRFTRGEAIADLKLEKLELQNTLGLNRHYEKSKMALETEKLELQRNSRLARLPEGQSREAIDLKFELDVLRLRSPSIDLGVSFNDSMDRVVSERMSALQHEIKRLDLTRQFEMANSSAQPAIAAIDRQYRQQMVPLKEELATLTGDNALAAELRFEQALQRFKTELDGTTNKADKAFEALEDLVQVAQETVDESYPEASLERILQVRAHAETLKERLLEDFHPSVTAAVSPLFLIQGKLGSIIESLAASSSTAPRSKRSPEGATLTLGAPPSPGGKGKKKRKKGKRKADSHLETIGADSRGSLSRVRPSAALAAPATGTARSSVRQPDFLVSPSVRQGGPTWSTVRPRARGELGVSATPADRARRSDRDGRSPERAVTVLASLANVPTPSGNGASDDQFESLSGGAGDSGIQSS